MKSIIKDLEKQLEKLREHIQFREDTYDGRSEKWQDSGKGEEYYDKTLDVETEAENLDSLIDELKDLS